MSALPHPTPPLPCPQVEVVPGVTMPTVGYGTAGLAELTADAVFTAIRTGYRLVDSAQVGVHVGYSGMDGLMWYTELSAPAIGWRQRAGWCVAFVLMCAALRSQPSAPAAAWRTAGGAR